MTVWMSKRVLAELALLVWVQFSWGALSDLSLIPVLQGIAPRLLSPFRSGTEGLQFVIVFTIKEFSYCSCCLPSWAKEVLEVRDLVVIGNPAKIKKFSKRCIPENVTSIRVHIGSNCSICELWTSRRWVFMVGYKGKNLLYQFLLLSIYEGQCGKILVPSAMLRGCGGAFTEVGPNRKSLGHCIALKGDCGTLFSSFTLLFTSCDISGIAPSHAPAMMAALLEIQVPSNCRLKPLKLSA